ncbi:hypothetical protein SCLCIDRAFT_8748 [Scleroderma citrinum Foug A]|uniref:Uncharacterized protein n=1 Tax=Scleroderma citrinum Foug A TaxID=1036808 RepID=A0A0C3AFX3_9AGAM|nr:hypothetical protein SCLCIDRAFT_8748 [Scleroderma citrinum Foug A]
MAMRDERRDEAEMRCRALAAGVPARAIAAFGRSVASLSCVSLVFILDVIITDRTSESVLSVKKHKYLPFHRQPNPLPPLLTSEGHYEVKEKAEITPSSRPTKSQVVKSVTALKDGGQGPSNSGNVRNFLCALAIAKFYSTSRVSSRAPR